jgi:hypothetical protein
MDGCNGSRPKQTPRNKGLVIATWNVRTMLKPGKRPRKRWLDDVMGDLAVMGIKGWREMTRKKEVWRLIVEEAKAHPGL